MQPTLQQAREIYAKSDRAFEYIPRTDNEKYFVFYYQGHIYQVYKGKAISNRGTTDCFALMTQENCRRIGYNMLKFVE